MKKEEFDLGFYVGDWTVVCHGGRFIINNHGMKLVAREDEGLECIIFDIDKKTVSVKVRNQMLSGDAPREVDLSGCIEFFNELYNGIEDLLIKKGGFKTVMINSDRTVFSVR